MTTLAVRRMTRRLTAPFARGADNVPLTLEGSGDPTQADVDTYDFAEHRARFNRQPDPRYLLVALRDVPAAFQVMVDYEVISPAIPATGSVTISVPTGTLAGSSFALNLGSHEGPHTRLRRVRTTPPAPDGNVANWWGLTALLGNMAKLLWTVGWERDHIRRHLDKVKGQRHLAGALGLSLDLLGYDLGVPRFPALSYSFEPDTIALYHLDDEPDSDQPEVNQVEDIMARYGGVGHHGTNVGQRARSGAAGRFGHGFALDANAEIRIPTHAALNPGVAESFTLECFVKPDANWLGDHEGHILGKHADPSNSGVAGWVLSIGEFGRGLPGNVRLLLSDGATQVILFGDESLPVERFHHLAGIIDRAADEARLYINGHLRAMSSIAGLGTLANTTVVRLGNMASGAPPVEGFQGIIDEVRLSGIARSSFHPVLGEADESYRRRLAIFSRWTLPTPANLLNALNEAVDGIEADPQPFLLSDVDATLTEGSQAVTICPEMIEPGVCLDAVGNRRVREADVSGTAAAETTFNPIYLITHDDTRVVYMPPPPRALEPGELPPDAHKMQRVCEQKLNKLLDLLDFEGLGGVLRVESAFDPRAEDLRAVGRGLHLTHSSLGLGRLAALAHRTGFSFTCHRPPTRAVYVSVAPGDYVDIEMVGGTASATEGVDLLVGETLTLRVRPALPADTFYQWFTIACGAGRADLSSQTTVSPTPEPGIILVATAPGKLVVKVAVSRQRRTVSATRTFRIGLAQLNDGQSIGADGSLGVGEAVAGEADDFFHPAYLINHDDDRASYGNGVNRRRMQPVVARRLDRLLALGGGTAAEGQRLELQAAYIPNAGDLHAVGRALRVRNPSLPAERLGALAHAAGFTYVRREGDQILIRQAPDEPVTITGPREVIEGDSIRLAMGPRGAPQAIVVGSNAVYVVNSGTDTVSELDLTTGRVRRAIKVGWQPVAAALNPDNRRLYSAEAQGQTVTAVDLINGNILASMDVQGEAVTLVHHPSQERLYVACREDDAVVMIDTSSLAVVDTISIGRHPTRLALTPDGAELWVTLDQDAEIGIIDTGSFTPLESIGLTGEPLDIAISPDGSRAYVTLPGESRIGLLDVGGRRLDDEIEVGTEPSAIVLAPDGTTVFVTDASNERLYLLEPDGMERASAGVRCDPADVAAGADRVYIVNRGSDDVSVVNPEEIGLAATWRIGSGLGERLTWALRFRGGSQARLSSTTAPVVQIHAAHAGPLLVRAVHALNDNTDPYTFELRLKSALEGRGAIIRKDQYDRIMNILNTLHPIGVEVSTRPIRERVIEVRDELLNAFPDYTYPNYRVRGLAPGPAR